ncbi:MAG: hypothetical protein R3B93_12145 [Bacteroidia bacterium]
MKSKQDQLGYTHEKHQQYYKGIKVEGATFTVHAMGSQITHLSGNFEYVRELILLLHFQQPVHSVLLPVMSEPHSMHGMPGIN